MQYNNIVVNMRNLCCNKLVFGLLLTTVRRSSSEICLDKNMAEVPCNLKGVHSIAYVTVPNDVVGKDLSKKIVQKQLAACVNIIPKVTSIYEWKGDINEDTEALLMIKTRTSRVDELIKFVREYHPYEVCEVISVAIDNGNPPYLQWISEVVPPHK